MEKLFQSIYIGYYQSNMVLCVSEEKYPIKYYMETIRRLDKSQYEIRTITLDPDSIISLYEDYFLYPYTKEIQYLTSRDIEFINREIDRELEKLVTLLNDLKDFRQLISRSDKLDSTSFKNCENLLTNYLSSVKSINRISKEIIRNSDILSPNIQLYLNCMKQLKEDRRLIEKFYEKTSTD